MSKIMVIAAHPDDEILGVGATIAKRVRSGDVAQAIILGEGQTSRWKNREDVPKTIIKELHKDTLAATECVGYKEVFFADFPDNRFDHVDLLEIIKYIEGILVKFRPDVVYTHHKGDLNIDHRRTYQAVLTATRPIGDFSVKEIYTFNTLSSTEWNFSYDTPFCPNVYEDVTDYMEIKLRAMECYESELCTYPHPRSLRGIEIQAQNEGLTVGKQYAESFMLVRKINE